jgi:hypothetical protein
MQVCSVQSSLGLSLALLTATLGSVLQVGKEGEEGADGHDDEKHGHHRHHR